MPITIKQPSTQQEFEQYYHLRWRILRKPWGQPEGSEKDELENACIHFIAKDNNHVIGIGRLQFNSGDEAQIRYMAIDADYEGHGIGRDIVEALEEQAILHHRQHIMLDAREPAVGFYEKLGYEKKEKTYLLFGSIQHYAMTKNI